MLLCCACIALLAILIAFALICIRINAINMYMKMLLYLILKNVNPRYTFIGWKNIQYNQQKISMYKILRNISKKKIYFLILKMFVKIHIVFEN